MNSKAIKRLSIEYQNWIKIFAERFKREFNFEEIDYWNWDYYVSTILKASLTIKNVEALEALKDHIEVSRHYIPSNFGQLLAPLAQSVFYIYSDNDQKANYSVVKDILEYELDIIDKTYLTESMKQTLYFYGLRVAILLYGQAGKNEFYELVKSFLLKLTYFSTRIIFLMDMFIEMRAFKLVSRLIHEIPHYRPKERVDAKYKVLNSVLSLQGIDEMLNLEYFSFKFFDPGTTQYLKNYTDDSDLWKAYDEAHSILLWLRIKIIEDNCTLSDEYTKRKDRIKVIIKKYPEIATSIVPPNYYLNIIYLMKADYNPADIKALENEFISAVQDYDPIDLTIIFTNYGIELSGLDDNIRTDEAFAKALNAALNLKDGIEGESQEEDTVNCKNLLKTIEFLNGILFQVKEAKGIQKFLDELNQMEISGTKILKNFPKKQTIEAYTKFLRTGTNLQGLERCDAIFSIVGIPEKNLTNLKFIETLEMTYLDYELLISAANGYRANGNYEMAILILKLIKEKFPFEIQPIYTLAEIAFEVNDIPLAGANFLEVIKIVPYHYGAKNNIIQLLENFSLQYDPIIIRPEFKIFKDMYQFSVGNLQLEYFSLISQSEEELIEKTDDLIEITPESLKETLVFFTDEYGKSIINTGINLMKDFSLQRHEENFLKKVESQETLRANTENEFSSHEQQLLALTDDIWAKADSTPTPTPTPAPTPMPKVEKGKKKVLIQPYSHRSAVTTASTKQIPKSKKETIEVFNPKDYDAEEPLQIQSTKKNDEQEVKPPRFDGEGLIAPKKLKLKMKKEDEERLMEFALNGEFFNVDEEFDLTETALEQNPELEKRLEELKLETEQRMKEKAVPFKPLDFGVPKEKQHATIKFNESSNKNKNFLHLSGDKKNDSNPKTKRRR